MECSSSDETCFQLALEDFEEIVWTWLQHYRDSKKKIQVKYLLRIFGCGKSQIGNLDIIQSSLFGERFSALDEYLNDPPYFYDGDESKFFSSIEIDGEKYDLQLESSQNVHLCTCPEKSHRSASDCVIVLVFSVVKPDFCYEIVQDFRFSQLHQDDYMITNEVPVILLGNQTELRNDSHALNNLLKQGKQPITYEMSEHFAREINAVKYVECSSSDGTGIENVFEEAVWASLRHNSLFQKRK